jgi:hypothetical protein
MSTRRIQLNGLTEADSLALQSMLRLSANSLNSQWEVVESSNADLMVYAFDTEAGQQAWAKHGSGLSAVITTFGNIDEPVDLILKKPLRKSSFADALNLIDDKLTEAEQHQAETKEKKSENPPTKPVWGSGLLNKIGLQKHPASHLPELSFEVAPESTLVNDTITDAKVLSAWMEQLPEDVNQRTSMLLKNLQSLLAQVRKSQQLVPLLEQYYQIVKQLLFQRDISTAKRDLIASRENQKAIAAMTELIHTLVIAYQQALKSYYEKGKTPDRNEEMLFLLVRIAEVTSFQIVQAFQYYKIAPLGCWKRLHQLYLYAEKAGVLSTEINTKLGLPAPAFFTIYAQITLTALSDPYSLARFDVFRLYHFLADFTQPLKIEPLQEKHITSTSSFLLTGYFCIDGQSDAHAERLVSTSKAIRQQSTSRLLDLQGLLQHLKLYFADPDIIRKESYDTDLKLLKKAMPQLNTTYERRFHRELTVKNRHAQVAVGVAAIHRQCISNDDTTGTWRIINQSEVGLMLKTDLDDVPALNIGEMVGLFENDKKTKLAQIRWLQFDTQGQPHMGVELALDVPVPVTCMPDGEAIEFKALLFPADKPDDPNLMLAERGLYSPKRQLRIKKGDETPYLVRVEELLAYTLDYELFQYKLMRSS